MTPLAGKPNNNKKSALIHMTWRLLLPFGHSCYMKLNHKQKPHSSHIFFHATVNVYLLCAPPPPPAIKNDDGKFMHFMLGPEEQTRSLGCHHLRRQMNIHQREGFINPPRVIFIGFFFHIAKKKTKMISSTALAASWFA